MMSPWRFCACPTAMACRCPPTPSRRSRESHLITAAVHGYGDHDYRISLSPMREAYEGEYNELMQPIYFDDGNDFTEYVQHLLAATGRA